MIARHETHLDKIDIWSALSAPLPPGVISWRQDGRPVTRDGRHIARFEEDASERTEAERQEPTAGEHPDRRRGIRVDAEFGRSMIYVTNEDKPGFIGRFASLLGDAKINIATFHLGRNKPGGDAIALVEVDGAVPADVLSKVQTLPQVKQAKALVF